MMQKMATTEETTKAKVKAEKNTKTEQTKFTGNKRNRDRTRES